MALKLVPVVAKKPAPKPMIPAASAAKNASSAEKPVTPAIVQQAGSALPPDVAKRLADLEKQLSESKQTIVKLEEKLAKKQEDKNAWRERVYSLADVEQWAQGKGDSPITGDWRLEYHLQSLLMYPYDVDKDDNVIVRSDLPPRTCLCLIPSSEIPVEPGESAQTNRVNRQRGYMCMYDDFAYDGEGNVTGVRGVPGCVPGASFLALIVPGEEPQTEATTIIEPEPAPGPAPEPKIEKPVKKLQKN